MWLRKNLFPLFAIVLVSAAIAAAQQPPATSPTTADRSLQRAERLAERGLGRHKAPGMGHRGGMGHLLRELNLTDEQRQQARAIMQRRLEGTKSQREELFKLREKRIAGTFTADDQSRVKALRQEMRTAMEGTRAEMESLLTADQKARLEELKQERKARFERQMKERQELLNKNAQ